MRKKNFLNLVLLFICLAQMNQCVYAAQVVYSYSKKGVVYTLLDCSEIDQDKVVCMIDGKKTEVDQVTTIKQTGEKVKTFCCIDGSESVSKADRDRISTILNNLIDQMGDNEEMEIDVITTEIKTLVLMTNDRYELYHGFEQIQYENQEYQLSNLLTNLLTRISQDMDTEQCFYRLIIFSNHYDNKKKQLEKVALVEQLKNLPFQIFTVGCVHKDNKTELKNLFVLSELTNGSSFTLKKDSDLYSISHDLNTFFDLSVVKLNVPETMWDGLVKEVSFQIETVKDGKQTIKTDIKFAKSNLYKGKTGGLLQFILGENPILIILSGIGVFLVLFKMKRKLRRIKKQRGFMPEVAITTGKDLTPNAAQKVGVNFMDFEDEYNKTVVTKPSKKPSTKNNKNAIQTNHNGAWRIRLHDMSTNRMFEKIVTDELYIGRYQLDEEKLYIVLDYNTSVSKTHCKISVIDDCVFIEDLGSLNGTRVNGTEVRKKLQLSNEDMIDIGQVKMRISIKQLVEN